MPSDRRDIPTAACLPVADMRLGSTCSLANNKLAGSPPDVVAINCTEQPNKKQGPNRRRTIRAKCPW